MQGRLGGTGACRGGGGTGLHLPRPSLKAPSLQGSCNAFNPRTHLRMSPVGRALTNRRQPALARPWHTLPGPGSWDPAPLTFLHRFGPGEQRPAVPLADPAHPLLGVDTGRAAHRTWREPREDSGAPRVLAPTRRTCMPPQIPSSLRFPRLPPESEPSARRQGYASSMCSARWLGSNRPPSNPMTSYPLRCAWKSMTSRALRWGF